VNVRERVGEEPPAADLPAADLPASAGAAAGVPVRDAYRRSGAPEARLRGTEFAAMRNQEDAPPCTTCGSIMIRSGSCYKCANCGTTSGCA
jgi:ribonucleoside-diphosphate reductase alpha chain